MAPCPPPDFDARLYGPHKIIAVVETLAQAGVAPAQLLAGSGLHEDALHAPETRVSYRQVATVFRNAIRQAADPAWALRAGARMHMTAYGMYGYGVLSSPTHADQLDFVLDYLLVTGPVARPKLLVREGRIATYVYEVLLACDPQDALYRCALEFAFSAHLTQSHDLYSEPFKFLSVHLACPEPAHAPAYRARFGCPVLFAQERNLVVLDDAWLERPRRLPNKATHGMMREFCKELLARLPQAGGVAALVQRTLVERMPGYFPNIDEMANALGMHPRTLRRRLETQGTSYREQLAMVRCELAVEYLSKTRMTTEEIASRLGYSDASNFRHAFVRWTGKTPNEYRSS